MKLKTAKPPAVPASITPFAPVRYDIDRSNGWVIVGANHRGVAVLTEQDLIGMLADIQAGQITLADCAGL